MPPKTPKAKVSTPSNPKTSAQPTAKPAPKKKEESQLTLHYRRLNGGDYEGWGLHVWNVEGNPLAAASVTEWHAPKTFESADDFGKVLALPLLDKAGTLGFIVHKGDEKDGAADRFVTPTKQGRELWLIQGNEKIFFSKLEAIRSIGRV